MEGHTSGVGELFLLSLDPLLQRLGLAPSGLDPGLDLIGGDLGRHVDACHLTISACGRRRDLSRRSTIPTSCAHEAPPVSIDAGLVWVTTISTHTHARSVVIRRRSDRRISPRKRDSTEADDDSDGCELAYPGLLPREPTGPQLDSRRVRDRMRRPPGGTPSVVVNVRPPPSSQSDRGRGTGPTRWNGRVVGVKVRDRPMPISRGRRSD